MPDTPEHIKETGLLPPEEDKFITQDEAMILIESTLENLGTRLFRSGNKITIQGDTLQMGDEDNNNFITFDGSKFDATQLRYIQVFTAGEDIAKDEVICIKPDITDYRSDRDTYVQQDDAASSFGSAVRLRVGLGSGSDQLISFLHFDETAISESTAQILRAELILDHRANSGTPEEQRIRRLTGAFTESTTWNTKPTSANDLTTIYGGQFAFTAPGSGATVAVDVTQIVRQWKAGTVTNHGFQIEAAAVSATSINYESEETDNTGQHPVLRIYGTVNSDGKAYKASNDDYLLSRGIKGIALETITSGNSVRVQVMGGVEGLSVGNSGGKLYLGTGGTFITSTFGIRRMIRLGKVISSSIVLLNIQDNDILIEKYPFAVGEFSDTSNVKRFYVPDDASYAIIYCTDTSGGGPDESFMVTTRRDWNSGLDVLDSDILDHEDLGTGGTWTFLWTDNFIEIKGPNSTSRIRNILFYT